MGDWIIALAGGGLIIMIGILGGKKYGETLIALLAGLLVAGWNGFAFIADENTYRGFPIPRWGSFGLFIIGFLITFISIRTILRKHKERSPVVDIDAEAAKAKAELDMMYFKDHGKMPEKPKDD